MNELLASYDDCVYWYILLDKRRTRLRFNNLRRAHSSFDSNLWAYLETLDSMNIPREESYIVSKWWLEDYFHDRDLELYICPADLISDIKAVLEE